MYINCSEGISYELSCPPSRHFNSETKQCETLCSAQCDPNLVCDWRGSMPYYEELWVEICTSTNESYYDTIPMYNQFDVYYKCGDDGELNKFRCPDGQHFNKETVRCEDPCSARCNGNLAKECGFEESTASSMRSTQKSPIEENETGYSDEVMQIPLHCKDGDFYPDRKNCHIFYECKGGRIVIHICFPGYHFNKKTKRCDLACNAKCDPNISCTQKRAKSVTTETPVAEDRSLSSVSTESSKKVFTLKVTFVCFDDGLFPSRRDCSKYINCSNGNAYELSCPPSRHFNNATKQCKTFCSAKCDPNLTEQCGWERTTESEIASSDRLATDEPENSLAPLKSSRELCSKAGTYLERNPLDCKTYFQCMDGDADLLYCPDGQHFSEQTLRCEDACDAHCDSTMAEECGWKYTTESKSVLSNILKQPVFDFECPENGLFANHACETFIQCIDGQAYLNNCPYGLHYEPSSQRCTTPCEARCDSYYEMYCKDEEKEHAPEHMLGDFDCETDGYHVNPLDCGSFIQCFNGDAYVIYCPADLHYSPTLEICMSRCDAKCAPNHEEYCRAEESNRRRKLQRIHSNSAKQPFPLVSEIICTDDGDYPSPDNCNSYITCILGETFYKDCPEGLHFSAATRRCVSPCEAVCQPSLACECGWTTCDETEETSDEVDCEAELDEGSCRGGIPRYAYDVWSGRCRGFLYSGCGGNSNNFRTMEECENKCRKNLLRGFRCPADTGNFGHYPDCLSYYHCKRGVPTLKRCPKGKAFDHKKSKCVTEYEATCIYECRDRDAVYPYEENCHKYIDCVNGISKLEKCPAGKAFDPEVKDCVDEKEVETCFWERSL